MTLRIAVAAWAVREHSGTHRRLFELLRAAAPQLAAGEELLLLVPSQAASVPSQAASAAHALPASVRVVPVPITPGPAWRRAVDERRELDRLLRRLSIDVLDCGTLPLPRVSTPCVLTIHDLRDLGEHRRRPRWVARTVLRRSVARAAHVVVPSRFTERELRRHVAATTPIAVVPGGVDVHAFASVAAQPDAAGPGTVASDALPPDAADSDAVQSDAVESDAVESDAVESDTVESDTVESDTVESDAAEPHTVGPAPTRGWFLHVGHLEPRKNLGMLLDAYALLLQRAGTAAPDLVLAGRDAGAGPALRARTRSAELRGRVRFAGVVPEQGLRQLYAGARAVLLPSLYEGFGLGALEALAAGKPLFVSDRGALPEVAGDAAAVLPATDARAWAEALHALLDAGSAADAPRAVAARRARALAFSWESAAARMLAVWRAAAGARAGVTCAAAPEQVAP